MASFWALLNNESEIGTTLHFIEDSSIDTGSIVASTRLAVQRERSYFMARTVAV
jgi:methionyl-tRNA formyltransferase